MFKPDKTKGKGSTIGLIAGFAVGYIAIAGLLILAIVGGNALLGSMGFPETFMADLINEITAIVFGLGAIIVLFFGVVSMLNMLYFSKDTEFFMSLPVKPSTIFSAKFTVVYLLELFIVAIFLLPGLIALGAVTGQGALYFLIVILGILFAPAIPMLLASLIAIPLMYLASYFKNKGALTSILILILFGGIFALYYLIIMQLQVGLGDDVTADYAMIDGVRIALTRASLVVYPFLALARLATGTAVFGLSSGLSAFVNFALSFGVVLVLAALSILISALVYAKGASVQMESRQKQSTGKEKFVQSGSLKTLALREWKMLIRTPSFAYSCLLGIVISPLLVFFTTFMGMQPNADGYVAMPDSALWFIAFGMTMMIAICSNVAASTAFTRDGKDFNLLKMLPVDTKTHLYAKMIVYLLITIVSVVLSMIVMMILIPNIAFFLLSILVLMIFAYGFYCFSMFFDLRSPKLDWVLPNEAMKNSKTVLVTTFSGIGFTIVFIAIGIIIPMVFLTFELSIFVSSLIVWILFAVLSIVIAIGFHFLLFKNANKMFEQVAV